MGRPQSPPALLSPNDSTPQGAAALRAYELVHVGVGANLSHWSDVPLRSSEDVRRMTALTLGQRCQERSRRHRRLVIACAELADGSDIQLLIWLDWPIVVTSDSYDEDAIAREFAMPSQSAH
jgi:hypothetical protein